MRKIKLKNKYIKKISSNGYLILNNIAKIEIINNSPFGYYIDADGFRITKNYKDIKEAEDEIKKLLKKIKNL